MLSEPLLQDTTWNATGGADNTVAQLLPVPRRAAREGAGVPEGVSAAVVRTNIAQSGALGDPYGSGVRTTWWVYGVAGPVRIVFDHSGGDGAPVTTASLLATNLKPMPPPPDADYFPLVQGMTNKYEWTNKKHLPQPEVESVTVSAVSNRSARITAQSISGPMKVVGQYGFDARIDGVTNLWGSYSLVATLVEAVAARAQAPLPDPDRPDGLRLQPGAARMSPGWREVGQRQSSRLPDVRRDREDQDRRRPQGAGARRHFLGAGGAEHAHTTRIRLRQRCP